jgi:uncharacterized protein (DUF1697 family)
MTQIVALLRGINLGKRRIKMDDLRKSFARMGLKKAETLIASGNVLFEGDMADDLGGRIAAGLLADFGFEVPTILRSIEELAALAAHHPFANHPETDMQRRYVYFLARPETGRITAPLVVPGVYEVTKLTEREICVVGYRQADGRTSLAMGDIAIPFKDGITNRNWNTIERMIEKAGG